MMTFILNWLFHSSLPSPRDRSSHSTCRSLFGTAVTLSKSKMSPLSRSSIGPSVFSSM